MNTIELVKKLRENYNALKNSLPWLDSCAHEEDKPAFPDHAAKPSFPSVKTLTLRRDMRGFLGSLRNMEKVGILRYDPEITGDMNALHGFVPELIENKLILSFLHTDVDFEEIAGFADKNRTLNVMMESGPRKILYFIEKVKKTLRACRNVYLCSYNFCNWLGVEELFEMKLARQLLFGTHSPRFSADTAMCRIAMAQIPWKTKCDIAGNNLRRLLGGKPVECDEINYVPTDPFIVDAHAHNIQPGNSGANTFPVPDLNFSETDWTGFMDTCSIQKLFLTPMESLMDPEKCAGDFTRDLRKHAPGRFFYFAVFHPSGSDAHVRTISESLACPACVGIKIHPSSHKLAADDYAYEQAWRMAAAHKKPIMTHSWDVSDYNPVQYLSHPDRFRKYVEKYPGVKFVLGHAGGRPGAFESVVKICRDYKNTFVDISGDYFDNGLVDALAENIGAGKILFGTDVDWMDPRCQMGAVLGSKLTCGDIARILRLNALEIYRPGVTS